MLLVNTILCPKFSCWLLQSSTATRFEIAHTIYHVQHSQLRRENRRDNFKKTRGKKWSSTAVKSSKIVSVDKSSRVKVVKSFVTGDIICLKAIFSVCVGKPPLNVTNAFIHRKMPQFIHHWFHGFHKKLKLMMKLKDSFPLWTRIKYITLYTSWSLILTIWWSYWSIKMTNKAI